MKHLLYSATVLIMGSAWLGIKLQFGVLALEVSIAYRFVIAATILGLYCLAAGLGIRFSWREHAFMAVQGALLFSLNQFVIYPGHSISDERPSGGGFFDHRGDEHP